MIKVDSISASHPVSISEALPESSLRPRTSTGASKKMYRSSFLGAGVGAFLFFFTSMGLADNPAWMVQPMVFDQEIDVSQVYELTRTPQEQLVSKILASGRDILLVRNDKSEEGRPLNPSLKGLDYASEELLRRAEFLPEYTGRMIPADSDCCGLERDLILIKESAPGYTLIHEYLHSLLRYTGSQPSKDLEYRFTLAERRQIFYQKKLFENPMNLLSPLWRRDILASQAEYLNMIYDRIRIGAAQEAIIEKLLARYIDEGSPYFDLERRKKGYSYGEAMVNNSITVHNNIHFAITWNMNTVKGLFEALKSGDLATADERESLSEKELQEFVAASEQQLEALKKTTNEILKMKAFYTQD